MNEVISKNFTVDDIHLIREKNSELTKSFTTKEKDEFYNKSAESLLNSLGISYKKLDKDYLPAKKVS